MSGTMQKRKRRRKRRRRRKMMRWRRRVETVFSALQSKGYSNDRQCLLLESKKRMNICMLTYNLRRSSLLMEATPKNLDLWAFYLWVVGDTPHDCIQLLDPTQQYHLHTICGSCARPATTNTHNDS